MFAEKFYGKISTTHQGALIGIVIPDRRKDCSCLFGGKNPDGLTMDGSVPVSIVAVIVIVAIAFTAKSRAAPMSQRSKKRSLLYNVKR
jgi:hypothetical protein